MILAYHANSPNYGRHSSTLPSSVAQCPTIFLSVEVSPRHFGTSAEMSGQFGTGAEVSYGHLMPKCLGSEVSWVRSVLTPNFGPCRPLVINVYIEEVGALISINSNIVQVCVVKLYRNCTENDGITCFYKELHVAIATTDTRYADNVARVWDRNPNINHISGEWLNTKRIKTNQKYCKHTHWTTTTTANIAKSCCR